MTAISTLRPGLLVSLKTSLRGNVQYDKTDLTVETDAAYREDGGPEIVQWETTRTISDPKEYERGIKARSLASSVIRSVCSKSAFGLLCPEYAENALDNAVARAHAIVDQFNATASMTRLHVYVIVGRVASDDVEAVRAINSEVRQLMDDMTSGMQKLDVKVIRDAANKARDLGSMLSPEAQVRLEMAIKTAREAAKRIVAAGETAAIEIDEYTIRKITEQRTAFLDLRDEVSVSRPQAEARAVDLTPVQE